MEGTPGPKRSETAKAVRKNPKGVARKRPVRGGQPNKLDRDAFHALLWRRASASGKLLLNQSALAEELDLDRTTIVRLMGEMAMQGRLTKIGERQHRHSLYRVVDPDVWRWKQQ